MLEEFVLVVRLFHYELFDTYYILRVISFFTDLILIAPTLIAFRHPLSSAKLFKFFLKTMEKYWKITGIFINIYFVND